MRASACARSDRTVRVARACLAAWSAPRIARRCTNATTAFPRATVPVGPASAWPPLPRSLRLPRASAKADERRQTRGQVGRAPALSLPPLRPPLPGHQLGPRRIPGAQFRWGSLSFSSHFLGRRCGPSPSQRSAKPGAPMVFASTFCSIPPVMTSLTTTSLASCARTFRARSSRRAFGRRRAAPSLRCDACT